ncbi:MAG: hypothetical protein JO324_06625, partial [Candidatus Eremiobacteraeota bacterium]|nr:hypothetical protein [Candidatus Eremiobacteraeota bacterium]
MPRPTGCGLRMRHVTTTRQENKMAMTHPVPDGVEYQHRVDEDLVAIAKTGD